MLNTLRDLRLFLDVLIKIIMNNIQILLFEDMRLLDVIPKEVDLPVFRICVSKDKDVVKDHLQSR